MSPAEFREQIAQMTALLANRPLDADLDAWLNAEHGVESASYRQLKQTCVAGVAEGWLCNREGGGIRYGRIFKPADDLHGFSGHAAPRPQGFDAFTQRDQKGIFLVGLSNMRHWKRHFSEARRRFR